MQFSYSTESVDDGRRFEYWIDVVCRHFTPAASRFTERQLFSGRFHGASLGKLLIGQMSSPQHSWQRTERHLRSGPNEDFMLCLMDAGHGVLQQSGREVVQRAGDVVVYDAGQPFAYDVAPDAMLQVRVPRALLLARFPRAAELTATRIAEGHSVSALLGNMVREAFTLAPNLTEDLQARYAGAILDVLSVALELQAEALPHDGPLPDAAFQKTLRWVDAHLDDSELTVDGIAGGLHVSHRTLNRICARHGMTPTQLLLRRRLEASRSALLEGRVSKVKQAAWQSGFSDLSHFCRVFKKAYGATPMSLLRSRDD